MDYNSPEYKESQAILQAKIDAATVALKEAEQFARDNKLSFYWPGPAYGMGGSFEGNDEYADPTDYNYENGWYPSSGSC